MGFHNFDIRGVLNESPIRNATSLYFNGTNNYLEIPGDVNLQQRSFTIETWVKKAENGRIQSLFTQGSDVNQSFDIGFGADNKIYFRVNNETIKSDNAYTDLSNWHHFALTYDHDAEEVQMYWDGSYINGNSVRNMYTDHLANGKMNIARNLTTQNQYFKGNLSEIRVWNIHRSLADIASTMNKMVNRSNPGTLYNWRLEEAEGTEAKDAIRERNATIHGATWQVDPSSSSVSLNGTNQYIEVEAGNYGISKEMDMTLEFWFNSSQSSAATLVSNGKGFQHTDSLTAWNIHKDGSGKIHVKNKNFDWVAVDSNYFDGQWHHFALVLNRKANTTVYIDGNQQKTTPSSNFARFGGAHVYLGALGYYNGSIFQVENYLQGNVDEFRFWNTARLVEQVKRDKRNRLKGDEGGLLSYVPFEEYSENNGVPLLTQSMKDIADTSHSVIPKNNAAFSTLIPTLKLPRAVQSIQFDYVLNNDKIVLTPNVQAKYIENVTLDITTKGVQDKNGNIQQSPKTWIAYIDKNQVVWANDQFSVNKELNDPYTITTAIVNKGGATKQFTVENIPSWMTVSHTSGFIAPNTVLSVTITINPNLAIGDYENDLQLLTDFGFAEKLTVIVKCRAKAPIWTADPSRFQYSMNIIGKLKINNVVSSDIDDVIAVFVGEECRGIAKIQYVSPYDDYFVFLDIYSNSSSGNEVLKSKIWDASVGAILTDVTPQINFESNSIQGSLSNPIIFNSNNLVAQIIKINKGWNWISLNVLSADSNRFDKILNSLNSCDSDVIKSQVNHRIFFSTTNWQGSLPKIIPNDAYMIKSNVEDTLVIDGILANPTLRQINILQGWNWIGFNSIRNLALNQALGGLNPINEDIIKGKNNFAIYDNNIGWIGSLTTLKPGEGYLYKSGATNSFYYPLAGYYKSGEDEDVWKNTFFNINSAKYESNMNAIVKIECNGLGEASNYTLAAYDTKGDYRGAIKLRNLEGVEAPYAFLTIAGDKSEFLSFRLYDEKNKSLIKVMGTMEFKSNEVLGKLSNPVVLKLSGENCVSSSISQAYSLEGLVNVYPRELNAEVYVELDLKVTGKVGLELVNTLGQTIFNFEKAGIDKKIELSKIYSHLKDLSSGIYLLNITVKDQRQSFKLIKN